MDSTVFLPNIYFDQTIFYVLNVCRFSLLLISDLCVAHAIFDLHSPIYNSQQYISSKPDASKLQHPRSFFSLFSFLFPYHSIMFGFFYLLSIRSDSIRFGLIRIDSIQFKLRKIHHIPSFDDFMRFFYLCFSFFFSAVLCSLFTL